MDESSDAWLLPREGAAWAGGRGHTPRRGSKTNRYRRGSHFCLLEPWGGSTQRVMEQDVTFASLSQSALRDFIMTDRAGLTRAIHAVARREGANAP
jgi:hypothetical protein